MASKAAHGVTSARILDKKPDFIRRQRVVGRFAVGMRYEKAVHEYLVEATLGRPDLDYLPGPWIEFHDKSGKRWCQPDALILHREKKFGIIYEVKYSHCPEAYCQLVELYLPVCKKLYPGVTFGLIEVVHWHDPSVKFPARYNFTPDPFSVREADTVSVHIYNAKRARLKPAGYSSRESHSEATG